MATYVGDDSNNTVIGSDGNDNISGLGGNDNLSGGLGDDVIDGGSGSDLLVGGPGHDTLTGGIGPDFFQGTAADLNGDIITDFHIGDHIQITDLNSANANISVNGSLLTYSGGSIDLANLGAGRFVVRDLIGGGVDVRLQQAAHNDFNGDGVSDVLLQNDNGTVRDWLGQAPNGNFIGNIDKVNILTGPEWHVIGTGDFNGDGYVDVLWQHDNGTVRDWLGQPDGSFTGNVDKVNIVTDWKAVGTGDFNGDGRTDILWQNANGTVRDWLGQADGSFTGNVDKVNILTGPEWHVIGTGDFNGDGLDDILWQNDNGTVRDWLGQADGSFVGNIDHVNIVTDWHAIGTGDFNGDGMSDVLWRNANGTIREWLGQSDGTFIGNTDHVNFVPAAGAHVVGIADYNGDGIDDLLWSNNGTITNSLGQPDGSFADNSAHVNITTGTEWHVQEPFVHDLFV